MKLKKIMSGALAGAMALSMSVTAFAEGETQATSFSLEGETATATIKVVLPSNPGKLVLNPYGLTVDVGVGKSDDAENESTAQIAAKDQLLTNLSDTDVKIVITGKATPTSADTKNPVTLATAPVVNEGAKAETKKSVFLHFQTQVVDSDEATPSWTAYSATDKATFTVLSAKDTAATTPIVLAKSPDGEDAASAKGYAMIHLDGNAASSPTVAWTAGDKVEVAFTFTFTPTVMQTSSGS